MKHKSVEETRKKCNAEKSEDFTMDTQRRWRTKRNIVQNSAFASLVNG